MQTIGTNVDGQEKNVHGDHKQEEGAKQLEMNKSLLFLNQKGQENLL